eukprot:SAG11_NODE_2054_length_3878_cov_1.867161_4_plen_62_part_00
MDGSVVSGLPVDVDAGESHVLDACSVAGAGWQVRHDGVLRCGIRQPGLISRNEIIIIYNLT